jgi:hypothetical protein
VKAAFLLAVGCSHAVTERYVLDSTSLAPHVLGELMATDTATAQTLELRPGGAAVIETTNPGQAVALHGSWSTRGEAVTLVFEGVTTSCKRSDGDLRCARGDRLLVFRAQPR